MPELLLTAYDVQKYLQEALPALRAAIYRGDLSQAKDVLAIYEETMYDEYDLSVLLLEQDYSWLFTERAADAEGMDPEGSLIGLTYPLILIYHHPEIFHVVVGGFQLREIFPFFTDASNTTIPIQPGLREGLRAMWEITGYLTPEATRALAEYCRTTGREVARSELARRILAQMAEGLTAVIDRGWGLVIERD